MRGVRNLRMPGRKGVDVRWLGGGNAEWPGERGSRRCVVVGCGGIGNMRQS